MLELPENNVIFFPFDSLKGPNQKEIGAWLLSVDEQVERLLIQDVPDI